ncbi:imidazole glycerol phosphate synthase subunit HisH [Aliarcobacter skirrowii]|uniref:Imidazole glycerol phosphate synthase subunit HisH n=1 Tax=Aliarcobacter skirrowii TaxID=28200 RepID=A0AAW9DA15_9BACT|nr:imidazole glycerol phosphate synthase subunit HisH [Aliarcobacter skirrowii]MDX4039814.1 imidazole glycerol phosphate synthase subunit HisH [Aliarcobacter skirrowii]MDX4069044.1 imidazole glycerol phosphate synthase subunit HisH [Aliarcobacter skirrowii]
MKLVIIDYGMGNIRSISSAFKYLGVNEIIISNRYQDIKSADKLLLPGVGSFVKAMNQINKMELHKILEEFVLENKKPLLGICLGMQLLCKSSEEDGGALGLGYIDAECRKFNINNLKVPHVGFNQVVANPHAKIYDGLLCKNDFYFTHSFRLQSLSDLNQSMCTYGEEFIASYERYNIVGTQFHPELSQGNGLKLLKNFIEKF